MAKLSGAFETMVKSEEWQELLKARGWTDYYLPADEFATFLDAETKQIETILTNLGLAQK